MLGRSHLIIDCLSQQFDSIFSFCFSLFTVRLHANRHRLDGCFPMQKPTPASMSWLRHGWRPTIAANNDCDWSVLLAYGSMVAGA